MNHAMSYFALALLMAVIYVVAGMLAAAGVRAVSRREREE